MRYCQIFELIGQYISTDDISQWLSQAAEQFPEVQSVFIDVILVVDAECSLEENDDHKARLAKVTALGFGLLLDIPDSVSSQGSPDRYE